VNPSELTGETPSLGPFPLSPPRPLQGTQPNEKFEEEPRAPLSSFFKPLQGTDAVIELILGQGRLLRTKKPLAKEGEAAVIAVGDPSVLDFEVLPNPSIVRITGKRAGVTDLTYVTADGESYSFEVRVQYDLDFLRAQLQRLFPGASIKLSQIREHLILDGQARSALQIRQIDDAVRAMLESQDINLRTAATQAALPPAAPAQPDLPVTDANVLESVFRAGIEQSVRPTTNANFATAQVINLMTVPGVQQVLLQVRIAELNRTGMREIGADTFLEFGPGDILGTKIGGANLNLDNIGPGIAPRTTPGTNTTGFGIFPTGRVEVMLRAMRQNSLVRILAEPNLVAMSGYEASFLAGGEFPVPVPQGTTGFSNVTVQFKQFGVQLNFVPHILDDEAIRLEVRPEVSTIDQSLGTTLVVGGQPVPGINTRRVHTTVQIHQGETLALAGLLQVTLDGNTSRIPGLGDLPFIGPMFSNTTHKRTEKELLVLVTPFLVNPLSPNDVPPLPGEDVLDPTDCEFFFLNRIEGRTGVPHRSTLTWDDPLHVEHLFKLERTNICGPSGFTY
jgi:pilus assembly protein CpaC